MQSSTNNHYLPEEFNENFFYDQHQQDEQSLYPSDPIMDDAQDEPEDINEHYLRGTFKGKESGLAGLEIKGRVRTLSPVLFYQIHTRYLIMCNNQLKNLPAEIGNLVNLVYLDLSCNRLKTLPSQIGDLTQLKRLYLESNCLKNLPYELGKLNLDELGLSNNPLGDQILSLYARPNGAHEVMNYLREKWNLLCSFSKMSSYKIPLPWGDTEADSATE